MAYTPKPNSGTLWPNERKASQNHPDVRGDLYLDPAMLLDLAKKGEPLIRISVAGWSKIIAGKECLTLNASAPFEKQAAKTYKQPSQAPKDDDEVPF